MTDKARVFSSFGIIFLIYVAAAFMQYKLFLGFDVSSLLVTTNQLLDGKNYVTDFFIPNPPLTLYLYVLPVYINKITGLNLHILTVAYIFIWAGFSLAFCARLMKDWRAPDDSASRFILLPLLAFIFLILPQVELGQRDCLLLIFAMPYLLSMVNRLNAIKVSKTSALTIGVLLALGVGMKPQYIFVPLLVESYFLSVKRNWTANFRLDTLSAIFCFSFYIAIIYIFHFKFLSVIFPYMLKNYYLALKEPLAVLLNIPEILFCFMPMMIFMLIPNKKNLEKVLLVALLGFMALYLSQRTLFPHHIIPSFSIAIVLTLVLMYRLLNISSNSILIYIALFLSFLLSMIIFNNFIYTFGLSVAWLSVAFTLCMILSVFGVVFFLSTKYFSSIFSQRLLATFFAMTFMLTPLLMIYTTYAGNVLCADFFIKQLLAFSEKIPGKQKIYSLSYATYYTPFILQTNNQLLQRYDCLWMISLIMRDIHLQGDKLTRLHLQSNNDPDFYINQISRDLNQYQPDIILLDKAKKNPYNIKQPFIYLDYFLENPAFKNAWSHYHYFATIESNELLNRKMLVYKRNID